MDMLKNAVVKIVQDLLIKKYPHTQQPPSMYAMVTEVNPKKNYKEVAIRILDSDLSRNKNYPEIPGIRTELDLKEKENVKMESVLKVLMLYGQCLPHIVGRYADGTGRT